MSKSGRKRKNSARYPCGKLRPLGAPPAQIKRAIAMASLGAADVFLATQLGWLRLEQVISDTQAAAGVSFAALVGRHDAMIGLPHRAARSPSYETGFAGIRSGSSPEPDAEQIAAVRRRFDAAIATLRAAGPRVEQVVRAVCVDDRVPDWGDRPMLKLGLDALAEFFGLSRRGHNQSSRERG